MKRLKLAICFLSAATMSIAPLAQAKDKENQQKELVKQYFQENRLNKKEKITVGEFWKSAREAYPQDMRFVIDRWVSLNRDQKMPDVQITNFKDSNNVEQVRVTLSRDGQSINLTATGNDEFPLKVNGVTFSKKEMQEHNLISIAKRLVKEDAYIAKSLNGGDLPSLRKNVVMTYNELKKLTPHQQAEYLVRLRLAMESAIKVKQKFNAYAIQELNEKYPFVRYFLGETAYAGPNNGDRCVIAGFISIYENGSCGRAEAGAAFTRQQLQNLRGAACPGADVPCNPLVYGFKSGNNPYCVPVAQVRSATANCNQQSPLDPNNPNDKKRIIESFLAGQGKKVDLKFNAEGKVSESQYREVAGYLQGLNGLIEEARVHCDGGRNEQRPDQDEACTELRTRAMDLQTFVNAPIPPPPVGDLPMGPGPCGGKPGSVLAADGEHCVCPEGTRDDPKMKACVPYDESRGGVVKQPKSECGFFCRNKGWFIALGVGALAFGLIWWLSKKNKKDKPTYTRPGGPQGPICTAPMVLLNGVCQTPSEGGTVTDPGSNSGGVR